MKKLTITTLAAAMGIAGTLTVPVQAADMNQTSTLDNGCKVGYETISSPQELNNVLQELSDKFCNIANLKACPSVKPDADTVVPDTTNPGENNGNPGTEETLPETELTFAQQVVNLVNAERTKAGLGSLTADQGIQSAALVRAKEIETSFSHTRPNGSSFSTVLTENGISFSGSGENIAWGQRTPEEVMNGWMNSEGHRANILNPKFTRIGVGFYQNQAGQNYWTQLFTY